jgi:hypothetical protein
VANEINILSDERRPSGLSTCHSQNLPGPRWRWYVLSCSTQLKLIIHTEFKPYGRTTGQPDCQASLEATWMGSCDSLTTEGSQESEVSADGPRPSRQRSRATCPLPYSNNKNGSQPPASVHGSIIMSSQLSCFYRCPIPTPIPGTVCTTIHRHPWFSAPNQPCPRPAILPSQAWLARAGPRIDAIPAPHPRVIHEDTGTMAKLHIIRVVSSCACCRESSSGRTPGARRLRKTAIW